MSNVEGCTCSVMGHGCSLQYNAECIEKNCTFLPVQNLLQSADTTHQQGEVTFAAKVEMDAL